MNDAFESVALSSPTPPGGELRRAFAALMDLDEGKRGVSAEIGRRLGVSPEYWRNIASRPGVSVQTVVTLAEAAGFQVQISISKAAP